ncbi:MAG: hypothetical protein U5L04_14045 [Trueperaceae bacterium]|nr:hypothetical protein [Trueperaceae bacterium]
MKKRIQQSIAIVLLTLGLSAPSHASVTCIAPEPTCAAVLLGAMVTAIISARDDPEADGPKADQEEEATTTDFEETSNNNDSRLVNRIRDGARNRPGGPGTK